MEITIKLLITLASILFLILLLIINRESTKAITIKILTKAILIICCIGIICILFYSEKEGQNEKEEYLKKIELILDKENNTNKNLILKELNGKDNKFLKNYYFEMLKK